jgi:hypothetical protein
MFGVAVHGVGVGCAGENEPVGVQITPGASLAQDLAECPAGLRNGRSSGQAGICGRARQPSANHHVGAGLAIGTCSDAAEEIGGVAFWIHKRTWGTEIEPPVHDCLLKDDAGQKRSVRLGGG